LAKNTAKITIAPGMIGIQLLQIHDLQIRSVGKPSLAASGAYDEWHRHGEIVNSKY
jgi:hypothetical protein